MSQQWYYAKGGQKHGPVTDEELQKLAASGELLPSDLIWRDGLAEWAQAAAVEGLFSAAPATGAIAERCGGQTHPASPSVTSTTTMSSVVAESPMSSKPPALWNPQVAGFWSLLFGWAFGSFLLARNWKALGNPARAKRCMFWFYAIFPSIPVFALVYYLTTPDPHSDPSALRYFIRLGIVLIPFFVWTFVEVNPQTKFVKEHFSNHYTRKPWLAALGIGASLLYGLPIVAGAIIGFVIGIPTAGNKLGEELTFNNGQLLYLPPVTAAEANRLGTFLVANRIFDGDRKTVQIKRSGNVYQYRMVVKYIEQDEKYNEARKAFCRTMSQGVFDGAPVELHLCDEDLNTIQVIGPSGKANTIATTSQTPSEKKGEAAVANLQLPPTSPKPSPSVTKAEPSAVASAEQPSDDTRKHAARHKAENAPKSSAPSQLPSGDWRAFVGVWDCGTSTITLHDDFTAHASLKKVGVGKWEYLNGEAHITWTNGWTTHLRRDGEGFQKLTWFGVNLNSRPNVSPAVKKSGQ